MNVHDKYDEYGILKTIPWEDIKSGDVVSYIDIITVGKKNVKTSISGIWDGEKVEFQDMDKTIVRTKRWLVKI